MLTKSDVYGVMVTYNPDESILNNIYALLNQVAEVLIIDNGSNLKSKLIFQHINEINNVNILYNDENMGIAYALNQGLECVDSKGYRLFLTMDQDSTLQDNCVNNMIDILNLDDKIVSVGPNYLNKYNQSSEEYFEVDSLITSGNLTYTNIAVDSGGYAVKLFIDSVDFDFSLSLRSENKKLAIAKNARMEHQLGELIKIKIFIFHKNIQIHSPLRHYYMFRNHYYIMKKYLRRFTKFCIKKELFIWKYFIEVLLLYPNKKENLAMIVRGVKHATQSKYGKYSN